MCVKKSLEYILINLASAQNIIHENDELNIFPLIIKCPSHLDLISQL